MMLLNPWIDLPVYSSVVIVSIRNSGRKPVVALAPLADVRDLSDCIIANAHAESGGEYRFTEETVVRGSEALGEGVGGGDVAFNDGEAALGGMVSYDRKNFSDIERMIGR
jgi:hypothetical protein